MSRSIRIAKQLGMPHGTAANKLRKNILFHLLKKLEENICFSCGLEIQSVEDLSIEHKEPWENRSVDLFWNINNIAFSHIGCNQPHVRNGGTPKRAKSPEGTSWCRTHKMFLPIEAFSHRECRWSKLRHDCKVCEKEYKDEIRKVQSGTGI